MPLTKKSLPIIITCLFVLVCVSAIAKENIFKVPLKEKTYGDAIVQEVTSIYDGDTFTVNIKDYPPIIGDRISVRVYGIDCPELKDKRSAIRDLALRAKQATVAELRGAKVIKLKNVRRDEHFRILAEVEVDGHSLGKALLDGGYAKPYDGGTKTKWGTDFRSR
ncbi:MAG: thermonuclease family protein [Phycisphaerae bacterium]